MITVTNVRIYAHGNWGTLLEVFPKGHIDDNRTTLACSDQNNPGRQAQFTAGTSYYISYDLPTGSQERWDGECFYDNGGTAPVEFRELDLLT
ncbi:hypothetical protein GCM10022243_08090 [Saccharothrix violaceirubra]|uniref:Uncharacterized protein n=1 Tax=Saccharothrix violaceirubra TaxID=413306 RepID=A0A7W7SYV0_9PSEU|nr:hypothetical protein [Saccharothrix violaceirubra]MBB4963221.1 hypothetical protein [Saccharothrix violaceirubra]